MCILCDKTKLAYTEMKCSLLTATRGAIDHTSVESTITITQCRAKTNYKYSGAIGVLFLSTS